MASADVYRNAMIDKAEREVEADQTEEAQDDSKKIDWSDMSAVNQERTRALRKRLDLQQKLKARQAAAMTEEEKEAEQAEKDRLAAEAAAAAIQKIEGDMQPKEQAKDGEKIKLGSKMVVSSEGNMTKDESLRLQAAVGTGKSAKLKAFFQLVGEKREIDANEVGIDEVISFSGCKDCEYTVSADCTKIFVEHCENFILRLHGRIMTSTVEVDACEKANILFFTKVGTLQVERCSKVNVLVAEKSLFQGAFMIWAGSSMLRLQVEDAIISCDFDLTYKLDPSINRERTQFKVWLTSHGKLSCDKIIRLENGFPTTKREDDDHERRKEELLDGMAKKMGITVHRKQDAIGGRVKPNDPCPCGSNLKYKKCCLSGSNRIATLATQSAC